MFVISSKLFHKRGISIVFFLEKFDLVALLVATRYLFTNR